MGAPYLGPLSRLTEGYYNRKDRLDVNAQRDRQLAEQERRGALDALYQQAQMQGMAEVAQDRRTDNTRADAAAKAAADELSRKNAAGKAAFEARVRHLETKYGLARPDAEAHGETSETFRAFLNAQKPAEKKRELRQDASGRWRLVDMDTGLDPDNKPVVGRVPPEPGAAADAAERRAGAVERRAAQSQLGATRREMQGVLAKRPKATQYVADPLTKELDKPAFDEALTNWRADSTSTAGALKDAQDYVKSLTGEVPPEDQQPLALEAQAAIKRIVESNLPDAEKQRRVAEVNKRLIEAVRRKP